jgi:hypothetical protein
VTFKGKVLIIPCYNEEEIIQQTHLRTKDVLNKCELDSYKIVYTNEEIINE